MAINLVVALTDGDWFDTLRATPALEDVNFWAPGARPFRALEPGELFLFKLHAPRHYIVGRGKFAYSTLTPCSIAWETFGIANGAHSLVEMRQRIAKYRKTSPDAREDFTIGCRILTQPFFLDEIEWLPAPASWSRNIVSFKTYTTDDVDGRRIWEAIQGHIGAARFAPSLTEGRRYGTPMLVPPRLGQGAFRMLVTDQYHRRCAVTGERTLPALEAAHIRPYAEGGEHEVANGLLLRRDIHSLFDRGYVTVTPSLRFEVSQRIRAEFENGRDYYRFHGSSVHTPAEPAHKPSSELLAWHNDNLFLG